jgi:hypothetical protein
MGKKIKGKDTTGTSSHRKDHTFQWNSTHQAIEKAMIDHLRDTKTFPSYMDISKKTGFSKRCIIRHMKEMNIQNMMPTYKVMSPAVMSGLFAKARSGSAPASKLWFQMVEGFAEKISTDNKHHMDKDVDDDHALEILEAGARTLRRKVGDAE